MTDDIVTRLRESLEMIHPDPQDVRDAIKEIERLRAEVNLWMGAAERFAESDPKFEAFEFYFRARAKSVLDAPNS